MIRTKDHKLRRALFFAIKSLSVFLAVLFAVQQPLEMIGQVAAADKDYYVSELKLFQAETEEEARRLCESEGYYCSQKDLDAGTGKEAVVLGYKITENKYEALYDIKLLHMNGGYTIKDYAEANAELEKSNSGAAEALVESSSEFIVNYENKSPKALEAYAGLNLFSIPEANNMKLGDYILQGKADNAFFAKVITHASAGAVNAISNFLTTGLTPLEKGEDEETGQEIDITWAHKVKDSNLWSLLDSDDITEDELDEYDKEMGDDARALFKQLQQFTTELENAKAAFNEEKTIEEAKKTNVTEVVDNAEKVTEEDNAMAYINAYEFLNQYEAHNGEPLGEFLADIGNETSERVDIRKLYPVLEPMSAAQRKMAGMSGILSIISTLGKNEKNKNAEDMINQAKKKMKELLGQETFSIWTNTNPEMADKKVAFTSDAIRSHSASHMLDQQATNSWEEAKKTVNNVIKWINVGSAGIAVLTFLAGKYGLVGLIGTIAAKISTSVVASSVATIASKVITVSTAISSWAGIFSLVILAITIIFFVITLIIDYIQKNKPKEYTTMPDFAVDVREVNGITRNVMYRAVKDNKNRIGDLNAYKAQNGWVCMFASDDPNAGSPIRADKNGNVFNILYGNANKQSGYDCVSYFGQITPGNCNTGAKNDDVNGIYINYRTTRSMANASGAANQGNSQTSDGVKRYYSDMVVKSGKTAEIARNKIIKKEGFQIYDQNLCADARRLWRKEEQYTYIGYKTTTNPDMAIRDIRVATFTSNPVVFGQIKYACAGTLGFPANHKDENDSYPEDLDGLYFTSDKEAGTPIEVGKLYIVDSHSKAKAGWEPVTTFSGLPYNFATTRMNSAVDTSSDPLRVRMYDYSYTGYLTKEDNAWNGARRYMYYEPSVTYTNGTKYLSGIFFGFGTDSERGGEYYGSVLANVNQLYDRLKEGPNVEEPKESSGVNLAGSYVYKGFLVDSNQKYLRMFYTWTYNPYRALTDVQMFRGEPYVSSLPYTIEKALTYPAKAASAADKTISYAAASVAVQRSVNTNQVIRGITPENAYMAPNGLQGQNTEVCDGFTREKQGGYPFAHSEMPLLPTNLYVAGYVKDLPLLTLDDVVISRNKHDGTETNGTITCDVSGDYTLGGSKPVGDFCSIQDLQDPYNLEAFNISYPSWTDEGGDADKTDEKNGSHFHQAGTSIYMYIKHEVVKKKYISRVFVGAATREDAKSDNKDVLKNADKQVDLSAMTAAVKAGSDEVILYDVAGDPAKAWYRYVKADDEPLPPDGGDPAAYISVARTDDADKAIRSIVLLKSDASAVAEQIQIDNAVYYCASNSTPIKMSNNSKYYLYYSYNQGTTPGKPITEINVSEDVFVSGSATALVVDKADTTEIVNGKIKTTQRSKPYGDASMANFIHAKYEVDTVYFNKIFTASGDTAKEAQLALLEQDCTEFCNINLNHNAGGKFVYFGYRGYSLNEEKINAKSSVSDQNSERENQLQEAVYDIICTVGEEFHPEGLITDRYQLYYAPVGKARGTADPEPTNLNEGTIGPKIYMYYTSMYVAQNYNSIVKGDKKRMLSTLPKEYLKSPLTKIGFALNDYVPASDELVDTTTGITQLVPWEYVIDKDYQNPIDFNEGAISFDSDHKTSDNRIAMFVQRDEGNVKPAAEITGGYSTELVTEGKMYLEKK